MKRWSIILVTIMLFSFQSLHVVAYEINGTYTSLESRIQVPYNSLEGKIFIVESMATWCEPCKSEFFELYKVYSSEVKNNTEIDILSLSVSPSTDTLIKLTEFKREAEKEFDFSANWRFGIDQDNVFAEFFNISIIPTTLILSKNGNLLKKWEGVVSANQIISYLHQEITISDNNEITPLTQLLDNFLFKIFLATMVIILFYISFVPNKEIK